MKLDLSNLVQLRAHQKDPAVWKCLKVRPDKRDPKTGEIEVEGSAMACLSNIHTILTRDRVWVDRFAFNELTGQAELDGEPVTDADVVSVALWLDQVYLCRASNNQTHDIIANIAGERAYHPVRRYLEGLKWDGETRIDGLLVDYLGAADSSLYRAMGRKWMVSAVARALDPGCKVDQTLILKGPQGSLKSTFFAALCNDGAWFKDTPIDLRNKDALQALQGVWIYEFAELDSIRPRESTTTKAFLSSQVDSYRPPYGRAFVQSKRQCVIVGTTNEDEFLADRTGSRRFWPVEVGTIALDEVKADRDQLWAEAVAAFKSGETWWLEGDQELELIDSSSAFSQIDAWEAPISAWLLDGAGPRVECNPDLEAFTSRDVLHLVLELPSSQQGRGAQMRVASILSELGCTKSRRRWSDGPTSGPVVPTSQPGSVRQWRWLSPKMQIVQQHGPRS
jgi:putative DNA primase/helicase